MTNFTKIEREIVKNVICLHHSDNILCSRKPTLRSTLSNGDQSKRSLITTLSYNNHT